MKILERLRNRSSRRPCASSVGPARGRRLISTVPQPLERERLTSTLDRVEAARDDREQLREEARYRRERLALYRGRLYAGRAASQGKLRELQRASDGAAARLRRAEAKDPPTRPPRLSVTTARARPVAGPPEVGAVGFEPTFEA